MKKSVMAAASLLTSCLVLGGAGPLFEASASATPAAPAGLARTAAPAPSTDIRVATYNILNVSLDKFSGEQRPWAQRRGRVIRQVLNQNLDVLGIQEANPSKYWAPRLVDGQNQFLDLRNGINKAGGHYELTNTSGYNCADSLTTYHCAPQDNQASNGTRILYNTERIAMVSQGSYELPTQVAGTNTQFLAYAVLRSKVNGREFLFTSVHLTPGASSEVRHNQIHQVIAEIDRVKGSLPVISVGDFNTQKFDPVAADLLPAMKAAGYGDTANQQFAVNPLTKKRALTTYRGWINSYNHFSRDVRAFSYEDRQDKIGNGIDWVFASNQLKVKQWKVVVLMNPQTLRLQGVIPSDHNMVRATIALP